jgi:ribonuclease R
VTKHSSKTPNSVPSKAELLAFIGGRSDKIGKREIARAFGLSADQTALMLRELAEEGHLERRRNKLHRPETLAKVVLADIIERDRDGDLIAVPTEWNAQVSDGPKIRVIASPRRRPGEAAGVGDRTLLRVEELPQEPAGGIRHRGRIIKIIEHTPRRVIGVFRHLPAGGGRLTPADKKQLGREFVIPLGATADAKDGDLVAAEVGREDGHGLATARVKERLGSVNSAHGVSFIAVHAHAIPYVMPRAALQEANAARPPDLTAREDWREVPFITIDPADARDHDDAVYAAPDTDPGNLGGHVLAVAIADVAHYVPPGSALDREALLRGNSVYFPDRVVPMLPEQLSDNLCSLKPGVDRAAVAVRIVIAADGRKRAHAFHRVLIRSVAGLNYRQVQDAVDGRPDDATAALRPMVLDPLYVAYAALKRAREDRSPLELDLPERKILLKQDGTIDRIISPPRLEAHRLIEEFMIIANVAAAETLERARVPLIYRVHDEPALEKVVALREFLRGLQISLPKTQLLRPRDFNRILARAKATPLEWLVHEVVLRSQSQAEYAAENYGHFGLNLRRYAHFTSPIRRYADLLVHRGLLRALKLDQEGQPETAQGFSLGEIAARISAAERRAMIAERETADRLIAHLLRDRVGATFQGRISGVTRAGIFVRLDETGADGFIPARSLGRDFFRYQASGHALVGDVTGETRRLGDEVRVRLVEALPVAGALRFELLSPAPLMARSHRGRAEPKQAREVRKPRGQPTRTRKGR